MFKWVYCYDGKNTPPTWSSRVCLFKQPDDKPKLELCVYVDDIRDLGISLEPEQMVSYWLVKGQATQTPVYPWAWLAIDTEVSPGFYDRLEREKEIVFTQLLSQLE